MGGVCVKGNVTMLPVTFTPLSFAQFNYFYYLCRTKNNNNPKPINPTNPNIMIIKHLHGGGNQLPLPPSMQCVARVALPAILFAMTVCLTSCAMQKV